MYPLRIVTIGVLLAFSACKQTPSGSEPATVAAAESGNAGPAVAVASIIDLQRQYAAEAIPGLQAELSRIAGMPVECTRNESGFPHCIAGGYVLIRFDENCGAGGWYAGVNAASGVDLMRSINAQDNAVAAHLQQGQLVCVEGAARHAETANDIYYVKAVPIESVADCKSGPLADSCKPYSDQPVEWQGAALSDTPCRREETSGRYLGACAAGWVLDSAPMELFEPVD